MVAIGLALSDAGGVTVAAAAPQTDFAGYQIAPSNQPTEVVSLAAGPDGALWFTSASQTANRFGRITTAGTVTTIPMPSTWHLDAPCKCQGGFDHMIPGGGSLWVSELHDTHAYIGRWSTSRRLLAEYKLPTTGGTPLAWGPDGNVWFSGSVSSCEGGGCFSGSYIGRLTPKGSISQFRIPDPTNRVADITAGPDGALWFTEAPGAHVGRITTSGTITEFVVPGVAGNLLPTAVQNITAGPDGAVWATLDPVGIVRIATDGSTQSFATPQNVGGCCAGFGPNAINAGPLGSLWFTKSLQSSVWIGRLSTSGEIAIYPVPASVAAYGGTVIAAGPDNAVWFGEQNMIVRMSSTATPATPPTGAGPQAAGVLLLLCGGVLLLLAVALRSRATTRPWPSPGVGQDAQTYP
ncbi:MAG: virginiamycin B lyase family protein [Candidatus Dormibacteria bacterium]